MQIHRAEYKRAFVLRFCVRAEYKVELYDQANGSCIIFSGLVGLGTFFRVGAIKEAIQFLSLEKVGVCLIVLSVP